MTRKRRTTAPRRRLDRKTTTIDPGVIALGPDYVLAAEEIARLGGALQVDPEDGALVVVTRGDLPAARARIFRILAELTGGPPPGDDTV